MSDRGIKVKDKIRIKDEEGIWKEMRRNGDGKE